MSLVYGLQVYMHYVLAIAWKWFSGLQVYMHNVPSIAWMWRWFTDLQDYIVST